MENKGLMIINHNIPCSCACRYCFFRSCKKANGIEYYRGKKIAERFAHWRKERGISDFFLCYAISHCADYPELIDNIEFNKSLDFIGAKYLQINGIRYRDDLELMHYLEKVKEAGVVYVDTTFYGLERYHDYFANREGDFANLMNIVKAIKSVGLTPQPTVFVCEENKNEISDLIELIREYAGASCKVYTALQDYRGNGENLEEIRLTKQSYEMLPDNVKETINISRYKTEEEWLKANSFSQYTSRNLLLALRPDNIDMLETMTCDEIINYLVGLDESYYRAIPDIGPLAKLYGNSNCQKLYRQRDLLWMWQKQYIRDNKLELHDVTDERLCGSMRF
ncbi:MAG: hypothetical protein Q8876_08710 [Bacillota bacterium]|nr:hypothetical protein [Bacillota bacterium]